MFDAHEELSADVRTRFFIGGEWDEPTSSKNTPIIDPATEEVVLEVPLASPEDAECAILAARAAFDRGPWPLMRGQERGAVLAKLADALSRPAPLLARLWTAQVGMPINLATRLIGTGIQRLRYYAELADVFEFETVRPLAGGTARVRKEPAGVALLIVPWNAPFPILCQKLGAALAAGCTCIVKPSPESPLDTLVLAECAKEVGLPLGVLNVLSADAQESAHLVSSPAVDKVSFTGSLATGRQIAAACAANMTRLTLELGGKSAAILLDDADLPTTFDALMPFAMPFSGQICFSQSRILVPRQRLDQVAGVLKARLEALPIGDPWEPQTEVGPVLNARQANRVLSYIASGRNDGAEILTGGGRSARFQRGHYIEPTLFTSVTSDMAIAREEIFGPVLTVQPYDSIDEAVEIANAPQMGLSGSVYSKDPERAYSVACRIRTGQVGVNGLQLDPSVPFGGYKRSGIGREGGPEGLEAFLEIKSVFMPRQEMRDVA